MVHGIGQRLEKSNLVDDVSTFRQITASLAERHLTPHQSGIQRVLFIPCQVRDIILYMLRSFCSPPPCHHLFLLNYWCHHHHLYIYIFLTHPPVFGFQWRKGLKLSGESVVDKITLDGVRGLRVMLSATAHDVLYYMSPIYCQAIINSVVHAWSVNFDWVIRFLTFLCWTQVLLKSVFFNK